MKLPLSVLLLCTGNSCRSIMAEALLAHHGKGRIVAHSAGSQPTGSVHPQSLAALHARAIPTSGFHSKSWDAFTATPLDIVITVCDGAAGETCPLFHGSPVKAHWGARDPARFKGSPSATAAEFTEVCDLLEARTKAFLALPLETLGRAELQKQIDEIGRS